MKKNILLIFMLFVLTSCFYSANRQIQEENNEGEKANTIYETKKSEEKNIYLEKSENISEENIASLREEITLDDLTLLLSGDKLEKDNDLFEIGKIFYGNIKGTETNKVTEYIIGGIAYENYVTEISKVPENLKRELNLQLTIVDTESKEKITSGFIYINGINFGSFGNGEVKRKFFWPIGIEKFNIMIRAENYGDAFLSLNSINSYGSLLITNVNLKKSFVQENVNLSKVEKISSGDMSMEFEKCSFLDSTGNCFEGEVTVKINHIKGDTANSDNLSLNMNAITQEGKIVYLQSGGMAFVDIITEQGELLQLDGNKTVTITYKVSKEDIEVMANTLRGNGEKNGYWWYDKNTSIWRESDAKYSIDTVNNTWSATITNLY